MCPGNRALSARILQRAALTNFGVQIRRGLELRLALRDWSLLALLAYVGLRLNEAVILRFDDLIDSHGKAREHLEVHRTFHAGERWSQRSAGVT